MIYLDANENPWGASPNVREVLQKFTDCCYRYPADALPYLKKTIGQHFGIKAAQVLPGAGATDVLRMAMEALCTADTQLVCPAPSFAMLDTLAKRLRVPMQRCPLGPQGDIPLAAMYEAVIRHTGRSVVYLSHPDCYSGGVVSFKQLASWIESLEGRAYVIVDEAYIEFLQHHPDRREDHQSMVSLIRQGLPHVLVLRTFSKAYGLAGLRVGYGLGQAALLDQLAPSSLLYPISFAAAHAVVEALNNPEWLEHSLWLLGVAREILTSGLDELGISYLAGPANFVLHRIPSNSASFVRDMEKQGIRVLADIADLPGFCRVSIGSSEQMTAYLIALRQLIPVAA